MSITCYVDEAGCPGRLPSRTAEIQPFLIVAAVCLRNADDTTFTRQFNALKQRLLQSLQPSVPRTVGLLDEVKGCQLRSRMRLQPQGSSAEFEFLNELLRLLKSFEARIFAQVAAKPPGDKFDGRAVYAQAMSGIVRDFHRLLELEVAQGQVVADFREPKLNAAMSAPICEAKYQSADELPRLSGAPTFGHSQSHAGLQVADIIASALVYPEVSQRHAADLPEHPHLHQNDYLIARRFRSVSMTLRHQAKLI